jgi:catechol 2,3-dioxygenase-like lactoylglutathione lyase family enzyme
MSERTPPDGAVYSHAAAVLPVRELARARDFYRDRLGFSVEFEWEDPPTYAVLRAGSGRSGSDAGREVSLHLSQVDPPAAGLDPEPIHPTMLYVFVHDVTGLHDTLLAEGVDISFPLQDLEYGMREFEIRDPDGHRLVFGQGVSDA